MGFAGVYRVCRIAEEYLLDDVSVFIMFHECLENPMGEVDGEVDELVLPGDVVATSGFITSRDNPPGCGDVDEES